MDKLQWMKLYYREPFLKPLVNKYECRQYVAERIGEAYLNPLIAVYDCPDDINWTALPNQFAMKVAHGSGMNIICANKNQLNIAGAMDKLQLWCSQESACYTHLKEWAYGGGRRCIVVEEFLRTPNGNVPEDYKLFCFNGQVKFVQVDVDRFTDHRRDYYDLEWHLLPFRCTYNNAMDCVPRPPHLTTMIHAAEKLAEGLPFARIDLYALPAKIVFGEITLYPDGGLRSFEPEQYNRILGDMLVLPERHP